MYDSVAENYTEVLDKQFQGGVELKSIAYVAQILLWVLQNFSLLCTLFRLLLTLFCASNPTLPSSGMA